MIAKDEADLIAWPVMLANAGFRAINIFSSEASFEVRYPTEFEPPQVPQIFGDAQPPIPPTDEITPVPLWGVMAPTAFETRNCGLMFTSEGNVSTAGDRIALDIEASRCEFLGFRVLRGAKTPLGIDGLVEVPDFLVNKVTSHLALTNGKRTLVGTFVESKPAPRVILFLLKAVATPSGTKSESP